jgi:phosphohistidine phosphatase
MTRLILMRHAKSDWSFDLEDHDRPLNKRGQTSAQLLGDWLRTKDYLPNQILCSTATRARETLTGLGVSPAAEFIPELYHASPETLLNALRNASGSCVLMIGHNPGIAAFAQIILQSPPDHARFRDLPTGGTVVADLHQSNWSDLHPGQASCLDFTIPRELMAQNA